MIRYSNQAELRRCAAAALEQMGFDVSPLRGTGGARVELRKEGRTSLALVRTSSDRWVGWMRADDGDWRGMDDGELVVVAALSVTRRGVADVYAFEPAEVRKAFDANLAAREQSMTRLKKTAPIFVALDVDKRGVSAAEASGLKSKAVWHSEIPLSMTTGEIGSSAPRAAEPAAVNRQRVADLLSVTRRQIAEIVGLPVEAVRLDLKIEFTS